MWWLAAAAVGYNLNLPEGDLVLGGNIASWVNVNCSSPSELEVSVQFTAAITSVANDVAQCPAAGMPWQFRRVQAPVTGGGKEYAGFRSRPVQKACATGYYCPPNPCTFLEMDYQNFHPGVPGTLIGATSCGPVFGRGGSGRDANKPDGPMPLDDDDKSFYPGAVRVGRITAGRPELSRAYDDMYPQYEERLVAGYAPIDGLGSNTGKHDYDVRGDTSSALPTPGYSAPEYCKAGTCIDHPVGAPKISTDRSKFKEDLRTALGMCETEIAGNSSAFGELHLITNDKEYNVTMTCYTCPYCEITYIPQVASTELRIITIGRVDDVKLARDALRANNLPITRVGSDNSRIVVQCGDNGLFNLSEHIFGVTDTQDIFDNCTQYGYEKDFWACGCYKAQLENIMLPPGTVGPDKCCEWKRVNFVQGVGAGWKYDAAQIEAMRVGGWPVNGTFGMEPRDNVMVLLPPPLKLTPCCRPSMLSGNQTEMEVNPRCLMNNSEFTELYPFQEYDGCDRTFGLEGPYASDTFAGQNQDFKASTAEKDEVRGASSAPIGVKGAAVPINDGVMRIAAMVNFGSKDEKNSSVVVVLTEGGGSHFDLKDDDGTPPRTWSVPAGLLSAVDPCLQSASGTFYTMDTRPWARGQPTNPAVHIANLTLRQECMPGPCRLQRTIVKPTGGAAATVSLNGNAVNPLSEDEYNGQQPSPLTDDWLLRRVATRGVFEEGDPANASDYAMQIPVNDASGAGKWCRVYDPKDVQQPYTRPCPRDGMCKNVMFKMPRTDCRPSCETLGNRPWGCLHDDIGDTVAKCAETASKSPHATTTGNRGKEIKKNKVSDNCNYNKPELFSSRHHTRNKRCHKYTWSSSGLDFYALWFDKTVQVPEHFSYSYHRDGKDMSGKSCSDPTSKCGSLSQDAYEMCRCDQKGGYNPPTNLELPVFYKQCCMVEEPLPHKRDAFTYECNFKFTEAGTVVKGIGVISSDNCTTTGMPTEKGHTDPQYMWFNVFDGLPVQPNKAQCNYRDVEGSGAADKNSPLFGPSHSKLTLDSYRDWTQDKATSVATQMGIPRPEYCTGGECDEYYCEPQTCVPKAHYADGYDYRPEFQKALAHVIAPQVKKADPEVTPHAPQQFAIESVIFEMCSSAVADVQHNLTGPPVLMPGVEHSSMFVPADYPSRPYFTNPPNEPVPNPCNCRSKTPEYACLSMTTDEARAQLMGCYEGGGLDAECTVCAWKWAGGAPGVPAVGLYVPSQDVDVPVIERDPLGNASTAAADAMRFYLGPGAPVLADLEELIHMQGGRGKSDFLEPRHQEPVSGKYRAWATAKTRVYTLPGTCVRAPYGRVHSSTVLGGVQFPEFNASLGPEALFGYCETRDTGGFVFCDNDPMHAQARKRWCDDHAAAGWIQKSLTINTASPRTAVEACAGGVCVYFSRVTGTGVNTLQQLVGVAPRGGLTVIVAPFSWRVATSLKYATRRCHIGGGNTHGGGGDNCVPVTTADSVTRCQYLAVANASGHHEECNSTLEQDIHAIAASLGGLDGDKCDGSTLPGPYHIYNADDITNVGEGGEPYSCYPAEDLRPVLGERGSTVQRPVTVVAAGPILAPAGPSNADDCAALVVQSPDVRVTVPLVIDNRGCAPKSPHLRAGVRFVGKSVTGGVVHVVGGGGGLRGRHGGGVRPGAADVLQAGAGRLGRLADVGGGVRVGVRGGRGQGRGGRHRDVRGGGGRCCCRRAPRGRAPGLCWSTLRGRTSRCGPAGWGLPRPGSQGPRRPSTRPSASSGPPR